MALGDGIRRNVATISREERDLLLDWGKPPAAIGSLSHDNLVSSPVPLKQGPETSRRPGR